MCVVTTTTLLNRAHSIPLFAIASPLGGVHAKGSNPLPSGGLFATMRRPESMIAGQPKISLLGRTSMEEEDGEPPVVVVGLSDPALAAQPPEAESQARDEKGAIAFLTTLAMCFLGHQAPPSAARTLMGTRSHSG